MNTPEPCNKCGFNYYDTMTANDPNSASECLRHLPMGDRNCKGFKHYTLVSMAERWGKI